MLQDKNIPNKGQKGTPFPLYRNIMDVQELQVGYMLLKHPALVVTEDRITNPHGQRRCLKNKIKSRFVQGSPRTLNFPQIRRKLA